MSSSPQLSSSPKELQGIDEIKEEINPDSKIGEIEDLKDTSTEILVTKEETNEEVVVIEEVEGEDDLRKTLGRPVPSSVSLSEISMDRQKSIIEQKKDKLETPHVVHINDISKNYPSTLKNFIFPKFPSNYIRTTKYRW